MMRYYTLDKALEHTDKEVMKETNIGFIRGIYNVSRMYLGFKPKIYYLKERDNTTEERK
jgi:hypothetical protein